MRKGLDTWLGHRASTNQCGKFELTNCNAGHKVRYSTSWDWPSLVISSSFQVNDGKLEKWQTCAKSESQRGKQTGTTLPHLQALTYLYSCASWQFLASAMFALPGGWPTATTNLCQIWQVCMYQHRGWDQLAGPGMVASIRSWHCYVKWSWSGCTWCGRVMWLAEPPGEQDSWKLNT